jgi:hypothetical protein
VARYNLDVLIDWPKTKASLHDLLDALARYQVFQHAPLSARAQRISVGEGHRIVLIAPDGSRNEILLEVHEASWQVDAEVLLAGGASPFLLAAQGLGKALAEEMEKEIVQKMRDAPAKAGASFRGATREELATRLLEVMQDMQLDFDEDGKPSGVFIVHPDSYQVLKSLEDDEELARRVEAIFEEKKREWLRRESYRRLVD